MAKVNVKSIAGTKLNKPVKITVPKTSTVSIRQRENLRRIDEKSKILSRYNTSEEIFRQLKELVNVISHDDSCTDLSINNEYNFGTEYKIELLLEVIRDLRSYTEYIHVDDNESIEYYELNYIRNYW